ncbi:YcjF family protein [Devosia submarina]|uniref:YcjF family protein n=1 Tax=Devosia submarina TaxID=1173082 RepID=UPI000D3B8F32|nr:TIGR01620 family protein [Devosia submarina]
MKQPIAHPVPPEASAAATRAPRAYSPESAIVSEPVFDAETAETLAAPPARRMGGLGRLAWTAAGILVSAGLGLAADRLIRNLFEAHHWLGWLGLAVLALLILALVVLATREAFALRRLRVLDELQGDAALASAENDRHRARAVLARLLGVYSARADLARARQSVKENLPHLFDGQEIIALGERNLMSPLDARAKALTAASARRVALVTAVSPRALVDIAFVVYESIRLAGAIAALYGARPGFFGFWRLTGAVLAHLAVTGGLVLTDGIVEQLVGQGIAAKLSARLGEGVVNGLMTVRVGIAAMRVVRPVPFQTLPQPLVRDFIPELTKLVGDTAKQG